jgi:hypothetical protein
MDSVALKECAVCHLEKPADSFTDQGERCLKCALFLDELLKGFGEEEEKDEVMEEVKDEKDEPELLVATCSFCRARKDAKLFTRGKAGSRDEYCDACVGKLARSFLLPLLMLSIS